MKQFLFLLSACVCPGGFLSAVSADESQPIVLATDEIVQEKDVTVSSADTEDVKSEISITATVNATDKPVDENVQDAAADSAPHSGVHSVPPHKQIVIRLGGKADKNSAYATIVDDSQAKVHMNGKIVVIGPDGMRQEFAISGNEAGKVFKIVPGHDATENEAQHATHIDSIVRIMKLQDASVTETESDGESVGEARMAIGVQCEDVPDAVRSHLNLGEKGIMVGHVRENSPASDAALMKFDVIVQIGDTDVAALDDLVSAVAASDGKELNLSIIRHGQPLKVVVTPRKMEFPVLLAPAQTGVILGDLAQDAGHLAGNPAWQSLPESVKKLVEGQIGVQNSLRKFHPGIVIEQRMPSNEKDMQAFIEHARKLAEDKDAENTAQHRKNAPYIEHALKLAEDRDKVAVAESIEALRDKLHSMEQQLNRLQKRLDPEAEEKK